jgi:hypothetical protein
VGPFRQEVVLDKPDALKPHLLSEFYLIDDLPYALMFRLRGGRSGNLYLVEQTEFHAVFPLSEVHNAHADVSHTGMDTLAEGSEQLPGLPPEAFGQYTTHLRYCNWVEMPCISTIRPTAAQALFL